MFLRAIFWPLGSGLATPVLKAPYRLLYPFKGTVCPDSNSVFGVNGEIGFDI